MQRSSCPRNRPCLWWHRRSNSHGHNNETGGIQIGAWIWAKWPFDFPSVEVRAANVSTWAVGHQHGNKDAVMRMRAEMRRRRARTKGVSDDDPAEGKRLSDLEFFPTKRSRAAFSSLLFARV